MKKQILLVATIAVLAGCSESESVTVANTHEQPNEIEEIKAFVLPDTLDIKRDLVIAAYYEIHPKKACVVFAYTDTTRTTVNKYSYSSDSLFVVNECLTLSYNEFKIKDAPTESYSIKPSSVVWMHMNGNMAASAEYERIDVAK